jgi:hypothetical protein
MAQHHTSESMLRESLPEMVRAAEWCIQTSKPGAEPGSVHGYPGAVLLCAAIASIGSWTTDKRRAKDQFAAALVDERLFDLGIDWDTADLVYDRVRNLLTHNAVVAQSVMLVRGSPLDPAIVRDGDHLTINLGPLLEHTRNAVEKLVLSPDTYISPGSRAKSDLVKKNAGAARVRPGIAPVSVPAASGLATLDSEREEPLPPDA